MHIMFLIIILFIVGIISLASFITYGKLKTWLPFLILAICSFIWTGLAAQYSYEHRRIYPIKNILTISDKIQIIIDNDDIIDITKILGRFIQLETEVLVIIEYPTYSYGLMLDIDRDYEIMSIEDYNAWKSKGYNS